MGADATGMIKPYDCDVAIIIAADAGALQALRRVDLCKEGVAATIVDDVRGAIAGVEAFSEGVPVFVLARPVAADTLAAEISSASAGVGMKEVDVVLLTASGGTPRAGGTASFLNIYCLPTPLRKGELRTAVHTMERAIRDRQAVRRYIQDHPIPAAGRIVSGVFQIRDLEQARNLATMLAQNYPVSDFVGVGIWELLSNAVEHGNLEIDWDMKRRLIESGGYRSEIERRLALPEFALRLVTVEFEHSGTKLDLRIKDEGQGFDYRRFLNGDHLDRGAPNGRGMMVANQLAFDRVGYLGCGNEVIATVNLPVGNRAAEHRPDGR